MQKKYPFFFVILLPEMLHEIHLRDILNLESSYFEARWFGLWPGEFRSKATWVLITCAIKQLVFIQAELDALNNENRQDAESTIGNT